jgi:translocation and assembly module TamB
MRFATNSEQVLADFNFDTEQLALVKAASSGPPRVIWSEPKLSSAGKAVYTIASERAVIDNLKINGQTMQLAGAALWDKPLSAGTIRVNGALQYDPTALATLIAGYTGPAVIVEGDRVVRFDARGAWPLPVSATHWSRAWQATAEAGWNKASVFGLPVSAGKLQAELSDGKLQTTPLNVSVGDGKLTTNPMVIFDPQPQRVIIPAGPLISNVQISPAVSEQMLKYVAPVLGGATRVDGKFSIDLAETQIPLGDAKKLSTEGRLSVHQLTVLPGPLIADVVTLIQRIQSLKDPQNLLGKAVQPKQATLMAMNDQQIDFKVIESRVYHRNLQFVVDDVPITSQGSVGFDQTLALELTIPIQDRWIDGEDALRGLAGQSLKIPIQGTFQNPRIDERAIADITKQIIRNTARDTIGGEINRQLEKLFQGK